MKIQQMSGGMFFIGIPKSLAKSLNLKKGQNLEFVFNKDGELCLNGIKN